jgi:8-oxo-dGTP pyrophosphatase MutT (NUDIX family)
MENHLVVLGIVKNKKGEVLIIKRKNLEKGDYNTYLSWVFPGGKQIKDENREETIEREILEETGYSVKAIEQIDLWIHPEFRKIICYFLCELLEENQIQKPKEEEEIEEIKWVKPEELKNYFTSKLNPKVAKLLGI